jgi:hypothetical protein
VIQRTKDGFARELVGTPRNAEMHTQIIDISCEMQVKVDRQP